MSLAASANWWRWWSSLPKQVTRPSGARSPKRAASPLHLSPPLSQKLPLLLFRMLTGGRCGRPPVSGKPRSSGRQRAGRRMRAGPRWLPKVQNTTLQDVEGGRDGGRLLRGAGRCGRPTTRQATDGTTTLDGRQRSGAQTINLAVHKPSTQQCTSHQPSGLTPPTKQHMAVTAAPHTRPITQQPAETPHAPTVPMHPRQPSPACLQRRKRRSPPCPGPRKQRPGLT